jgi:amicoumacin kinase
MLKRTKEIYNDDLLREICSLYKIADDEYRLLDGFENFIYEFRRDAKEYILRVTHSLHRTADQISAEVDWLNFLADRNVPVARAIHSPAGNLIEEVDAGDTYFLASAFEKAKGRHVRKQDINDELFITLGKLIGKTHAHTKEYDPQNLNCLRPQWDIEINGLHKFIPLEQEIVRYKFSEIVKQLRTLPKDKDSFGLIHTDAHFGNMFIDKDSLTLFDFDDSAYKWFISDIAIVLFYSIMRLPENVNRQEFGEFIFKNFMKGYIQKNRLDPYWLELMPDFLKLREIVLYAVVYMGFDVKNLTDPWCKWYLDGRKEKIEMNIPYLDLNYKKLIR